MGKGPVTVDVGSGPMVLSGLGFWMRMYERVRAARVRRRLRRTV